MLASLVIPVFNKLEYTKICIESLLADQDRLPLEIIVVDNASSDGTSEYIKEMQNKISNTRDKIIYIQNKSNRGVAPAWNQGVHASSGSILGVLNNDIIVTNGWLKSILWALETHKLNLISPFAATGKLDYNLASRAKEFTKKNFNKIWNDYDFCAFVMPKSTFSKIGDFDEKFEVGGYEDTDYCYRLKAQGMKYGVSGAGFIHHFGSTTLGDFKKTGDKHAPKNRDYFIQKWGEDPSAHVNDFTFKFRRTIRKFKMKFDRM